ncbi:DUF3300 domain-containing protein [Microbispora sp. SCL1-1]|uniref:DUF3300 domain-containing protein n=1 Tax=unclassified Microbispora TaxID=2614687 RepID=UPI001156C9DE|nr:MULTISPECIES: DUF3300 domain-containing protein [unclassified Microbispora]NJP27098.1 DUF3300 domain-containing protein [Microbispora sp. CL1-1]TQS11443.1 DUF3300 domain-containing protein [Microbispora sp. SCL1-1]
MTVIRIVSVRTGDEVSRAELGENGAVTYSGGESAVAAVRSWLRDHPGRDEADAVRALATEGWSNGYLMIQLDQGSS